MKYFTHVNGEFTEVLDVDSVCNNIRALVERSELQAANATKAYKELKEEKWRDEELQRMKEKLDEKTKDLHRGFGISKEEDAAIQAWKDQHYTNQHNAPDIETRLRMQGVSGGLFSYVFLPTSIGVSGTCRCNACYRKALQEVGNMENYIYLSLSEYWKDLEKAVEKYDAEFEFQSIG